MRSGNISYLASAGMQKIVTACPLLASRQEFRNVMALRGIDVIATRLWFDKKVDTRYPANVLSGFEPGAGEAWGRDSWVGGGTHPWQGPAVPIE